MKNPIALSLATAAFALGLGTAPVANDAQAANVPVGATILNQWNLFDHPDGGAALPTYGLRLDGLLTGNQSEIWTFSFQDKPGDGRNTNPVGTSTVLMTLYEIGGAQNININGTVFGGRKKQGGSQTDDFDVFGNAGSDGWEDSLAGSWALDFTYQINVTSTGDDIPLEVTGESGSNNGTITALTVADIATNAVFNLTDEQGTHPFSFKYADDNHRCKNHPAELCADRSVGHGWVNHSVVPEGTTNTTGKDITDHLYASDFLFTGVQVVPVPAALPLMVTGLAAFGLLARRRAGKASA